jgi:hypothetical protein
MPVQEQASKQKVINALEPQAIGTNTTTTGAIIDTADYDSGVYFAMLCYAYTDGTYTMKIEHGDDASLSDAADVPAATKMVYGSLPALTAADSEGDVMAKEGVFGTNRYLRVSIVSTGVTTGASLAVVAVVGTELYPTPQAA